ncbi:universal stress protein family protein [Streptomyces sp. TLI_235]|nr:universal stress protein [Streptomyces sp. TLI_235]PBC66247.1 universal stress protein family protein [Streptomyces sp. TLI_235]
MGDPVIVGVDGSASSLDALDVAAREARLRGAALRMVHAFGHSPGRLTAGAPPWHPADYSPEPMVQGALARAEERARMLAPDVEIRPSRTSTTNWDAGHRFELVS